jgi:hypothetical protein
MAGLRKNLCARLNDVRQHKRDHDHKRHTEQP